MNEYINTYITLKNNTYLNYTLYSDDRCGFGRNRKGVRIHVDYDFDYKLKNVSCLCDKSIHPQKGSSIHLVGDCPYAIDDIRKNYTIKRDFDTGDYNIISDSIGYKNSGYIRLSTFLVFDSKKIIIASVGKNTCAAELAQRAVSVAPITTEDIENSRFIVEPANLYRHYVSDDVLKILNGNTTKPLVYYKNLDINGGNELTLDVLRLVYEAGKKFPTKDNLANYVIQLNVLNNHNWRDYPGTISMIMCELLNNRKNTSHLYICGRKSCYSKVVKELIGAEYCTFKSEKDFNLGQEFLNSILGLDGIKFTDFDVLRSKLYEYSVHISTFNRLYNNIIKLTPKKYEDFS